MSVDEPDSEPLSASDLEMLRRLDDELGPDPFVREQRRPRSIHVVVNTLIIVLGLVLLLIGIQTSLVIGAGGCVLMTIGSRGLLRRVDQRRLEHRSRPT